jgi:hypothetical protein
LHLWLAGANVHRVNPSDFPAITIRPARAQDETAIMRLAGLDSAPVPRSPLIVAEVEGELLVALSVHNLAVIAHPFHRTLELAELLRDHAERAWCPARHPEHRQVRAAAPRLLRPRLT